MKGWVKLTGLGGKPVWINVSQAQEMWRTREDGKDVTAIMFGYFPSAEGGGKMNITYVKENPDEFLTD